MFAFIGLFVFALVGLNIWAIVDVARQPEHAWKAIQQDRTLWLLLTLLAGLPCSIAYLVAIRPRLDAVPPMLSLPGWYPDPMLPGVMRYYDGTHWTVHAMPMLPPAPPYPPAQPYPYAHPAHHPPAAPPWPQQPPPPPPDWPPRSS